MFLLLGIGFLMGGASLLSEFMGGCVNFCMRKRERFNDTDSIASNPRSHERQTARERLNSTILHNNLSNHVHNQINHVQFVQNQVDCIIHEKNDEKQSGNNDGGASTSSDSIVEEINKMFEDVFGEENVNDADVEEEIDDDNVTN